MNHADVVTRFEQSLDRITRAYRSAFDQSTTEPSLRVANARFTGPQGELTGLLKLMPDLPKDKRRELGQRSNQLKEEIQKAGFDVTSSELVYRPTITIPVSDKTTAEKILRLLDHLEGMDDVQKVFANFEIPDEFLTK